MQEQKFKRCRDCQLFVKKHKLCGITIINDGAYQNLKVEPDDPCFFEVNNFSEYIQQIRAYEEETPTGKKVKIEYPDS